MAITLVILMVLDDTPLKKRVYYCICVAQSHVGDSKSPGTSNWDDSPSHRSAMHRKTDVVDEAVRDYKMDYHKCLG